MSAGCQAQEPLPAPVMGRTVGICYGPSVGRYLFICAEGHTRVASVCSRHVPTEETVPGCLTCYKGGQERPMTWEQVPLT